MHAWESDVVCMQLPALTHTDLDVTHFLDYPYRDQHLLIVERLKAAGVAAVYTPKDYDLTRILADIVEIVDKGTREAA